MERLVERHQLFVSPACARPPSASSSSEMMMIMIHICIRYVTLRYVTHSRSAPGSITPPGVIKDLGRSILHFVQYASARKVGKSESRKVGMRGAPKKSKIGKSESRKVGMGDAPEKKSERRKVGESG